MRNKISIAAVDFCSNQRRSVRLRRRADETPSLRGFYWVN